MAIARSASELAVGQELVIQLGQGGVKVKVMEINEPLQAQRKVGAPASGVGVARRRHLNFSRQRTQRG